MVDDYAFMHTSEKDHEEQNINNRRLKDEIFKIQVNQSIFQYTAVSSMINIQHKIALRAEFTKIEYNVCMKNM